MKLETIVTLPELKAYLTESFDLLTHLIRSGVFNHDSLTWFIYSKGAKLKIGYREVYELLQEMFTL